MCVPGGSCKNENEKSKETFDCEYECLRMFVCLFVCMYVCLELLCTQCLHPINVRMHIVYAFMHA